MDLKNISKLYAVAFVFSGCVSREPVVKHFEYEVKQNDGTVKKELARYGTSEKQFTLLGNAWNGASYGAIGCGYGAYLRGQEGFSKTNSIPVFGPVANGMWGLTSGAVEGLYKGATNGWMMKYGEGPTLDDYVADQVQEKATQMKNWANRCIGE